MCVRAVFLRRASGWVRFLPAIFLTFAAAAPARADFLDDLFGGGSSDAPPAPAARARPTHAARDNFSIKLKESRRSQQRARAGQGDGAQYSAGSRPQKPLLCAAETPPSVKTDEKAGESTAYLRDETLRAGDSVVTPGQIVVFKGGGGCPHASGDFVSLARSSLPKVKRNALVSLQQGLKSPRQFGAENDPQAGPKVAGEASE